MKEAIDPIGAKADSAFGAASIYARRSGARNFSIAPTSIDLRGQVETAGKSEKTVKRSRRFGQSLTATKRRSLKGKG
jgi:hypothetical protein